MTLGHPQREARDAAGLGRARNRKRDGLDDVVVEHARDDVFGVEFVAGDDSGDEMIATVLPLIVNDHALSRSLWIARLTRATPGV